MRFSSSPKSSQAITFLVVLSLLALSYPSVTFAQVSSTSVVSTSASTSASASPSPSPSTTQASSSARTSSATVVSSTTTTTSRTSAATRTTTTATRSGGSSGSTTTGTDEFNVPSKYTNLATGTDGSIVATQVAGNSSSSSSSSSSLSTGAIVGIAVGGLAALIIIGMLFKYISGAISRNNGKKKAVAYALSNAKKSTFGRSRGETGTFKFNSIEKKSYPPQQTVVPDGGRGQTSRMPMGAYGAPAPRPPQQPQQQYVVPVTQAYGVPQTAPGQYYTVGQAPQYVTTAAYPPGSSAGAVRYAPQYGQPQPQPVQQQQYGYGYGQQPRY